MAVFDGVAGVEPQSETVWRQADKYHVPRIAFINKMDRIGADFDMSIKTMIDRLGAHPVPVQLPIGAESDLKGIIDLIAMKAIIYKDELGKEFDVVDIPAEFQDAAQAAREHLLEEVSHYDDELVELILEEAEIPQDTLKRAIRQATLDLDGEVDVAGRVDDVDAVVVPLARGRRGRDRDAALLLLLHPVHRRRALVHLAELVGASRVEQDALRRRRLARVDVGHDPDVAGLLEGVLSWHLVWILVVIRTASGTKTGPWGPVVT